MSTLIKCDICDNDVNMRVNTGDYGMVFTPVTNSKYRGGDFYIDPNERKEVDICIYCSNKICEAQNKAVEEIKKSFNPQE